MLLFDLRETCHLRLHRSQVVSQLKETKFAREGLMLDKYEYESPAKSLVPKIHIFVHQFLQDARL
jgi:hypothetical protein